MIENKLSDYMNKGYFYGEKSIKVYYEYYKNNKSNKVIVISHGFCECIEKYKELIKSFFYKGYSVYILEHRGHGRSGCLSTVDKTQVSVDKFDYYINDLKTFLDTIVISQNNGPLYLFAHSMGGGIGALFLEKYPNYFKKAILNAPMMEIDTGKFPEVIALIVSKIFILLGKGDSFLFGQGKFSSEPNFEDSGTSCKEKFYKHHYELINNVELQRGGGSFRWLNEAIKATRELKKQNNASKVSIPVLLFQAEIDTFVKPRGHYIFAKYAKQCNIEFIKNAKHEIYFENDSIVEEYLRKIFDFLDK